MNYDEWNEIKKKTHNNTNKYKNIKVGEVYWVKVGLNIGNEVYGKGKDYARLVLVINKLFDSAGNRLFLGVPLSSRIYEKANKYRYVFDSNGSLQTALLSQIKVFDNKRVMYQAKIKLLKNDFLNIKQILINEVIN
ncbi:type II toxin-antitoxin system PemK/MazF family toxin [Campylobacter canadensis]|uniref:Type II toxin-antitoxin system PemK/MazF family toxin n=1 Tax=Campylobacter canadensis TaxID=449520 RepID=A0ABS7WS90_9BACT|nr:type II toxin-antitoxin system PemK/MazF family toxin [Campylobacter canadensis]MBZ7987617.1 type II toxin-antitoxin system PemK/MazF family toxin [Campylobacter canadensis]MBZ7994948.1 type II toxin-antitoxin system PemK/MazF family toxin [Campylobacter canadensis]MBZ7996902.1 type II toxin-antitoxin system PemK/MazF family toxin [Campylobacter canadensis]MBZ7998737.1 type II toxin-antitoxin system PemK/MazF family toxin [Campylobacter canadensis]MBZ8000381.1 type II toxin-antitoxin system